MQKKKEKSKNNQSTPFLIRLNCLYGLKVCLFPHIPHFGTKTRTFFAADWRKWRDSALRHREGHIHAGGKCCLCSAQPVRYPKISTPAAPREHRHNHGRFVQRCRDIYQRYLDRTAGREPAVGSLDGKTAAFAWYASKQIVVSVVQVRRCGGGATLTHFVSERWVLRSRCMDEKRG